MLFVMDLLEWVWIRMNNGLLLQNQSAARIYGLIAGSTKNLIYNKYRPVGRLATIRYLNKFASHTEK